MFHLKLKNPSIPDKGTRGHYSRVTTQITAVIEVQTFMQQSLDHAFNGATRPTVLALLNAFCRQLTEDFQETFPQPRTTRLLSAGIAILTRSDHSFKILKTIIHHGLVNCQPSQALLSSSSKICLSVSIWDINSISHFDLNICSFFLESSYSNFILTTSWFASLISFCALTSAS